MAYKYICARHCLPACVLNGSTLCTFAAEAMCVQYFQRAACYAMRALNKSLLIVTLFIVTCKGAAMTRLI